MPSNCPNCNAPVVPGAVFCDNCGTPLQVHQEAAPPPVPAPPVQPSYQPPPHAAPAAGTVVCAACHTPNAMSAQFCENCGNALSQPPQAGLATPNPGAGAVRGRFVIQASNASLPIPANKAVVTLGREDPVSGVFPEIDLENHQGLDNGVGRQHARVTNEGGQAYVEDLQSVNRTRLRGELLQPGKKYPINNGDELVLGRLKLTYFSS